MTAGPVARGARHDDPGHPARVGVEGPQRRVVLVDLLDRLLAGGVVISGDLTLSIAEVDLVTISLRVLITSVRGDPLTAGPPYDLPETPA